MNLEGCPGARRKLHQILLFSIALIILNACGGSGGGDLLGGGFSQGEVRSLNFGLNGEAEISFGELSGDEEFAMIFFAANINEGFFNFSLTAPNQSKAGKMLSLGSEDGEEMMEEGNLDPTAQFHQFLREEEESLSGLTPLSSEEMGGKAFLVGTGGGDHEVDPVRVPCANETGLEFKVINSLNDTTNYDTTCGIEVRRTNHMVVFVDQEVLQTIPNNKLNSLIDDFEGKIPLERELLGKESDVDGDGIFYVYFTPGVNRLGQNSGGFITGYFFGGDLYSTLDMPSSNQMEVLYMSVPDPNGQWGTAMSDQFWFTNIAATVLTHEYHHMINFNYKVLLNSVGTEEPWANEGISHLLEDLSNQNLLNKISPENPSRVALYLNAPQESAFTGGISLAQRGGAYLFFRYLYEQADLKRFPRVSSGTQLLRELVQSEFRGTKNIEEATGWPMKNILLDFYVTLQLSDTGITDNPRYNFSGVCLNCSQEDNRGTQLNGVNYRTLQTIPVESSVSSPGGIFFNTYGDTIAAAGNQLKFVAAPGMNPGGAIIRLR